MYLAIPWALGINFPFTFLPYVLIQSAVLQAKDEIILDYNYNTSNEQNVPEWYLKAKKLAI
jgi:hypothetical protein